MTTSNNKTPIQPNSTVSIRRDPHPVGGPFGGIYAYGVETKANARTLRISGQVGEPPEGELSLEFKDQCRQAIWNVEAVLREADMMWSYRLRLSSFIGKKSTPLSTGIPSSSLSKMAV